MVPLKEKVTMLSMTMMTMMTVREVFKRRQVGGRGGGVSEDQKCNFGEKKRTKRGGSGV